MQNKRFVIWILFFAIFGCAISRFGGRYYQLLEKERKIFLGLKAIDSISAERYINLPSPTERGYFYERYWQGKSEQRKEFEERIEYAYREFARLAPLSDQRIQIYVKYGPPSIRQQISPRKKLGVAQREIVRPAEIWTYNREGIEFDFIRIGQAYQIIACSEFGENVRIPFLKEDTTQYVEYHDFSKTLDFNITFGRFRQRKNLTRLEFYLSIEINDTTDIVFARSIKLFNQKDSLIAERKNILKPKNGASGIFYDEVNFWLEPMLYKAIVELFDIKNKNSGKKILSIDLLEYQNDAKEISDLVPAKLIDNGFTDEKFNKPCGRLIPLTENRVPVGQPFYFYHEVYNLNTTDGLHHLRTIYEVYNKETMKKEIVDILINEDMEIGDVAFLSAKYHPMDLPPGEYLIVAKDIDILSEKERTAICEFTLFSE